MTKASYMRVRVWAALALVACAPARGEDSVRARCLPDVGERCQETDRDNTFIIDGKHIIIDYFEDEWYWVHSCKSLSIDEAWPMFPRLISFDRVELVACAPEGSYIDVLRALNATVTHELQIYNVPSSTSFTAESFSHLPPKVEELSLSADGELMIPEPGVLANLDGIRKLYINNIHVDKLPSFLDGLSLKNTGYVELPVEAQNVVTLKIKERKQISIPFSMPKLSKLSLYSAVSVLPKAPVLETLWLYQSAAANIPAGSLAEYRILTNVRVNHLPQRQLPDGFLQGAAQLTQFELTDCDVSTLPADLFASSPNLESIDLSSNEIEALPAGLFSMNFKLKKINLERNKLRASDLHALVPLVGLRELNLARNPLGDLCEPGQESVLSSLTDLTSLTLERAELTRTCVDWLRVSAPSMLDLRGNRLRSVPCVPVRTRNSATVDLRANPLERVACARADYERVVNKTVSSGLEAKILTLKIDKPLKCDCDAYWLSRFVTRKLVDLDEDPVLLDVICRDVNKLPCEN